MQTAKTDEYISVEDYLAGELSAEIKHEYVDGQVLAVSGASKNPVRIILRVLYRSFFFNHQYSGFTDRVGDMFGAYGGEKDITTV